MTLSDSPSTRRSVLTTLIAASFLGACNAGKSDSDVTGVPESASPVFLGDLVWCDLNCDGTRDPGEPGIPQVTVRLIDAVNAVVGAGVTDADGIYGIESSIGAGTYRVVVDETTVPNGLAPPPPLVGGDIQFALDVPPRAGSDFIRTDLDFGFCPIPNAGVVGDFVWHDLDCDGIQDAGEPGIDGVDVVLKDAQGLEIDRATTAQNGIGMSGHYEFTGLALDATYMLEVDPATLPPGFVPTACEQGGNPVFDSDCSPAVVNLVHSILTVDFGFCTAGGAANGEIGDFVWLDLNGNGIQDPSELDDGIDGIMIRLLDASGQVIRTTTTQTIARAGSFRFTGLPAGAYTVEIVESSLCPGLVAAPCGVGTDPTIDNNCSPAQVFLPTNDTIDNSIDFGFERDGSGLASIGDFVWNDLDRDGLQDAGEPGLQGVRVLLRDALGVQICEDRSDADGRYEFLALPAGTYMVKYDPASVPNMFVASPSEVGNDPAIDSNASPTTVTLTVGQQDDTIDFGFYSLVDGSIGDRVWDDTNCNGLQDAGESGIEHVRVLLKNSSGQVIGQQTTDSSGHYTFFGLTAGTYTVDVDPTTLPEDYVPAPCEVGNDPTIDSNCSPATVTLTAQSLTDETIDFGFHHPPCAWIGDFVWFDENCDGFQDWWEDGIGGVVIILKDGNGTVIQTTTSAHDGSYAFDSLCAGTYTVEFDPASVPTNMLPTIVNAGTDPATDSNPNPSTVVLATNISFDETIDFGFIEHP